MKFKVFGLDVPVKLEDISHTNYDGYFDPVKKEIIIHSDSQDVFNTMIHELLHSGWFRLGLNQTSIPYDIQELIVENFATLIDENFETIIKFRKPKK